MPYDVPLRHISGDDARSLDLLGPQRGGLRSGHRQVQEEHDGCRTETRASATRPSSRQTRDLREQVADQQAGRALGPHVYVVADLHPLGGKSEEVDRARRLNDLPQHRRRDDRRRKSSRAIADGVSRPNQAVSPVPG